jgi:hypothetical protein
VAILVYVTLDLSLPTMPGAFVFEPDDSVESIGGGRLVAKIVVVPAAGGTSFLPWSRPPGELRHRLRANRAVWLLRCRPEIWLPRATRAPSPAAEDPH